MSKIYRFTSFEALVDMIQKKALAFVIPNTWQDPYESYVLTATRYEEGKQLIKSTLREITKNDFLAESHLQLLSVLEYTTYGQCWTKKVKSMPFGKSGLMGTNPSESKCR